LNFFANSIGDINIKPHQLPFFGG
jgi:hypothetical protein